MAQIIFSIDDAKVPKVIDAMLWTSPKLEGFTNAQWVKEVIRRWVIDQVAIYQKETTVIVKDDTLIT
jgi:hypothetical protein